jgi:hypothetical protein
MLDRPGGESTLVVISRGASPADEVDEMFHSSADF